jgi:hypothetical protein
MPHPEYHSKSLPDFRVAELVVAEIANPTLEVTKQYLQIHQPAKENDQLQIARIDRSSPDNFIVAYLPVGQQQFYFALTIDPKAQEVIGFETEPGQRLYFRATSETLSLEEIKAMTTLQPTESWSKGEPRKHGKLHYNFSAFHILPNPEPDTFENKLQKLLTHLEKDPTGIRDLVEQANGYLQVATYFHNGNGMVGGPTIDRQAIQRMAALNLEINFDLYAEGNAFPEE